MFTGIISDVGRIIRTSHQNGLSATIACHYPYPELALGASIACSGVCLTVTEAGTFTPGSQDSYTSWFSVDISPETLSCTLLSQWQEGTYVNLEQALRLGDTLGGHIVTGHVDGIAMLLSSLLVEGSHALTFSLPALLVPFVAPKGSITLDGVSLTVNHTEKDRFTIMIIPHTWQHTTFQWRNIGEGLHAEIDVVARYATHFSRTGIAPEAFANFVSWPSPKETPYVP